MAPCGPQATLVIHFAAEFGNVSLVPSASVAADLAVLAGGNKARCGRIGRGGQQPVMDLPGLVAVVEPVDVAIGQCEMRNIVEKYGGDAMSVEIKRGDCGHAQRQGLAGFECALQPLCVELAANEDKPAFMFLAVLPGTAGDRLQ